MRAPDHGRPYDWPYRCDDPPPESMVPTVDVLDDEPPLVIYGADGAPLVVLEQRRPIGYRRLTDEDA